MCLDDLFQFGFHFKFLQVWQSGNSAFWLLKGQMKPLDAAGSTKKMKLPFIISRKGQKKTQILKSSCCSCSSLGQGTAFRSPAVQMSLYLTVTFYDVGACKKLLSTK